MRYSDPYCKLELARSTPQVCSSYLDLQLRAKISANSIFYQINLFQFVHQIACSSCNAMRYPPPATAVDYFDMFDMPRSYEMDVKLLAQKFKALQRLFHPDLFVKRADKEKALSETW